MKGWEVLKVRGISVKVHPSWVLFLVVFAWFSRARLIITLNQLPYWSGWALGIFSAILFLLTIFLHELAHSMMARREGLTVRSINIFPFVGVSRLESECNKPLANLRIALSGPISSLLIGLALLLSVENLQSFSPGLAQTFASVGSLNVVFALFNLLPGLPLDGGVVLKSLVWYITGSQRKGVDFALKTTRSLSLFAIVLGLMSWLLPAEIFLIPGSLGLWFFLLGWLGFVSSRAQKQVLSFQQALCDLLVGKPSARAFRVLEANSSLRRLSELKLKSDEKKHLSDWVLVCNSGRWTGYVTDDPLKNLPVQYWDKNCLSEYAKPISELPSIGEKDPLWKAVVALEKTLDGRLLVFNLAGLPSGTLDRADLTNRLLKHLGLQIPNELLELAKDQNIYPLGLALPELVQSMISEGLVKL